MAKSLFASLPNQIPKRAVNFQEQDDKIVEEREENIHKIGNIRGHLHEFHNAFSTCSHFRTNIGLHFFHFLSKMWIHKIRSSHSVVCFLST